MYELYRVAIPGRLWHSSDASGLRMARVVHGMITGVERFCRWLTHATAALRHERPLLPAPAWRTTTQEESSKMSDLGLHPAAAAPAWRSGRVIELLQSELHPAPRLFSPPQYCGEMETALIDRLRRSGAPGIPPARATVRGPDLAGTAFPMIRLIVSIGRKLARGAGRLRRHADNCSGAGDAGLSEGRLARHEDTANDVNELSGDSSMIVAHNTRDRRARC